MVAALGAAVRSLRRGGLVVYPTDTLLGLGARARDRRAVDRLVAAKGRSAGQAISICVSSTEEIEPYAELSDVARRFVRRHLPGPYTVLLRPTPAARRAFASAVAGGQRIGFRVPDHPVARALARRAGPITATSANAHGAPPARTVAEARRAFGPKVDVYLSPTPPMGGIPSTIVDLTGSSPRPIPRGA